MPRQVRFASGSRYQGPISLVLFLRRPDREKEERLQKERGMEFTAQPGRRAVFRTSVVFLRQPPSWISEIGIPLRDLIAIVGTDNKEPRKAALIASLLSHALILFDTTHRSVGGFSPGSETGSVNCNL
ncbi:unnamed protein product [Caenorhabditis auriculariae]|uniref:Uncharacterized protein n=1 Tax=Caenorhabditis auriculariae TaxID=2777116 RepID=A0A8S1GM23_9PELO|nr:unnamed protein product [Caenorhabditis auriculariae]